MRQGRFLEPIRPPKMLVPTVAYADFRCLASAKHHDDSMKALEQDPKILLVDDNAVVRDMLVDLVASLGYHADSAANGQEALDLFDRRTYGLVLTDLVMPGMSGWDVLAAVRRRDATMPVVIVTGPSIIGDRRAFPPGAAALTKPVDVA